MVQQSVDPSIIPIHARRTNCRTTLSLLLQSGEYKQRGDAQVFERTAVERREGEGHNGLTFARLLASATNQAVPSSPSRSSDMHRPSTCHTKKLNADVVCIRHPTILTSMGPPSIAPRSPRQVLLLACRNERRDL